MKIPGSNTKEMGSTLDITSRLTAISFYRQVLFQQPFCLNYLPHNTTTR